MDSTPTLLKRNRKRYFKKAWRYSENKGTGLNPACAILLPWEVFRVHTSKQSCRPELMICWWSCRKENGVCYSCRALTPPTCVFWRRHGQTLFHTSYGNRTSLVIYGRSYKTNIGALFKLRLTASK